MVKTLNAQQTAPAQDEAKKQRKKQAKREAKLMLELGDARKDVQRAEQKFSKAQSNLEASRSRLREIEEELAQIRDKHTEQSEPPVEAAPVEQSHQQLEETGVPDQGNSYEDNEAVEELHQSSFLPQKDAPIFSVTVVAIPLLVPTLRVKLTSMEILAR